MKNNNLKYDFLKLNQTLKEYVLANNYSSNCEIEEEDAWEEFSEDEYRKFEIKNKIKEESEGFMYASYGDHSGLKIILEEGVPVLKGDRGQQGTVFFETKIDKIENEFYFIEFNHPFINGENPEFLNFIIACSKNCEELICIDINERYSLSL